MPPNRVSFRSDMGIYRSDVRSGIGKVYNHYDAWLKYKRDSHIKLVKAQLSAPDKSDRIAAVIRNIYTNSFVNKFTLVKQNLSDYEQYYKLCTLNGKCKLK